ncbi:MAG: diguanylate cyclase [Alkalispirochaetaceae bacterium]
MKAEPQDPSPREPEDRDPKLITDSSVQRALADVGVFQVNFRTGEGFPNRFWTECGYSPRELRDRSFWLSLVHPDDLSRVKEAHDRVERGETHLFEQEYRIRTRSGRWRWILSSGSVVSWDEEGRPLLYFGRDTDITDQKLTEAALREARQEAEDRAEESERLRIAGAIVTSALSVEETVDLILHQAAAVCSFDGALVLLKERDKLRALGVMGEEIDRDLEISFDEELPPVLVFQEEQPRYFSDVQKSFPGFAERISSRTRSWLGIPLIARSEALGVMGLSSHTPHFFSPNHRKVMLAFADHVSIALYNARRYDHTRELAMTDPLTGAGTRHSFDNYAVQQLDLARRHGRDLSVMMVDLDNFKRINDRHGHPAGDVVLATTGHLLREELRTSDIICRYGGDEFAVLLPETGTEEAFGLGERIRNAVVRQFADSPYEVSVTIGVAGIDRNPAENVWDLLKGADLALYKGKNLGRNRVTTESTS